MQIHPSVIMSISEHHTRALAIRPSPDIVVGALLGKQIENGLDIIESFELCVTRSVFNDEQPVYTIDKDFYKKKLPLVQQVFAELDLIGWYSTTPMIENEVSDGVYIALHRQISEMIPNPIFLKLNPYKREHDPKISGVLPLNIYEPVIAVEDGAERLSFIDINWTIATEDVEIIGLEHNAKLTHVNIAPSAAIDNLRLQYTAVKMLRQRIKLILKFVKDIQAGVLPYNERLVAEIAKLSRKFPLMNTETYIQAYNVQCNDVALNAYLGILTKGSMCKLSIGAPNSKTRAFTGAHARR